MVSMKKLIFVFIILLLAIALGVLIHNHPAYAFITVGHTTVQASLWFTLIAVSVVVFLTYQLLKLLRGIYHIPSRLHHFAVERKERKLHQLTQKALYALLEGRWNKCETYFHKSAQKDPHPFFNYIGAAQAAFKQHKPEETAHYLKKAEEIAQPSEGLTLEIVRARWQLATILTPDKSEITDNTQLNSRESYAQALLILQRLQTLSPTHPFILNGLKDIYRAMENWKDLQTLLPQLRRYDILSSAELDALEQRISSTLFDQAPPRELEKNWRSLPKKWRKNPLFISIYTKHLLKQNQHHEAEKILKAALKKQLDPILLEQYAMLNSKDPVKQLARAETWLREDRQNPDLLFCLGTLCAHHRLWGKARMYLEMSLKYKPRPEIYPILGEVLEHLDQKYSALDCYKAGLNFLIQHKSII